MPYESQSDKAAMDRALKATERMLSLEARKAQRFKTSTERMNEALRQERERILAENAAEKEAAQRKRTQVGPVPGESVEKQLAHIWEILAKIRPDLVGTDVPTISEPPTNADRPEDAAAVGAALPDGTAIYQILYWTGSEWALLDFAYAAYMVLQRKTDDTLGWDFVRAHA